MDLLISVLGLILAGYGLFNRTDTLLTEMRDLLRDIRDDLRH